jgi:hypothetical protein
MNGYFLRFSGEITAKIMAKDNRLRSSRKINRHKFSMKKPSRYLGVVKNKWLGLEGDILHESSLYGIAPWPDFLVRNE